MFKGRWILLSLLLIGVIVFRNSFSQSFFLNNTPSTKTDKKTDSITVKQATPEQFKSNVNNLFKQNQKTLEAEVNSKVSKSPPVEPLPGPPPPHEEKKAASETSAVTAPRPTQTNTVPTPPPLPKVEDASTNTLPPPPTQPDSQPYTGFQGEPPKNNDVNQQPSGGGWNIQY